MRNPKLGFRWQEFITFKQKKDAVSMAETPLLLNKQVSVNCSETFAAFSITAFY